MIVINNKFKRVVASLLTTIMFVTQVTASGGNNHGGGTPTGGKPGGGTPGKWPVVSSHYTNAISIFIHEQPTGIFYEADDNNYQGIFGTPNNGMPYAKNGSGAFIPPFIYTPNKIENDVGFLNMNLEAPTLTSHIFTPDMASQGGLSGSKVVHVKGRKYSDIENKIVSAMPRIDSGFTNNINSVAPNAVTWANSGYSYIENTLGISKTSPVYKHIVGLNKNNVKISPVAISSPEYESYINILVSGNLEPLSKSPVSSKVLSNALFAATLAKYQNWSAQKIEDVMKYYLGLSSSKDYPIIINDWQPIRPQLKYYIGNQGFSEIFIEVPTMVYMVGKPTAESNARVARGELLNKGIVKMLNFKKPYTGAAKSDEWRSGGKAIDSSLENVRNHFDLIREAGYLTITEKTENVVLTNLAKRYVFYRQKYKGYNTVKNQTIKLKGFNDSKKNPNDQLAIIGFNVISGVPIKGPVTIPPPEGKHLEHSITASIAEGNVQSINYDSPVKYKKLMSGINVKPVVGVNYKPKLTTSANYNDFKNKVKYTFTEFDKLLTKSIEEVKENDPDNPDIKATNTYTIDFLDIETNIEVKGTQLEELSQADGTSPRFSKVSGSRDFNITARGTKVNAVIPAGISVKGNSADELMENMDKQLSRINEQWLTSNGILQCTPITNDDGTVSLQFYSDGKYYFKISYNTSGHRDVVSKFNKTINDIYNPQDESTGTQQPEEKPVSDNYDAHKMLPLNSRVWVDLDKSTDEVKIDKEFGEQITVNWWSNPQSYGEFKNESSGHTKAHAWDVFQGIPHDRNVELNLGNSPFAIDVTATYTALNLEASVRWKSEYLSCIHHGDVHTEHSSYCKGYSHPVNSTDQLSVVGPGKIGFWTLNSINVSAIADTKVSGTMKAKTQNKDVKVFDDYTIKPLTKKSTKTTTQQGYTTNIDTYTTTLNDGETYTLEVHYRAFTGQNGTNNLTDSYGFSFGSSADVSTGVTDATNTSESEMKLDNWESENFWFVNSDGLTFKLYRNNENVETLNMLKPFSIKKYLDWSTMKETVNSNSTDEIYQGFDLDKQGFADIAPVIIPVSCESYHEHENFTGYHSGVVKHKFPYSLSEIKELWRPNDITQSPDSNSDKTDETDIFKVLWDHDLTIPVAGYQGMQTPAPYKDNNKSFVSPATGIISKEFTAKPYYKIWQLGNPIVQNDHYSFIPENCVTTYTDWDNLIVNNMGGISVPKRDQQIVQYKYLDQKRNKDWSTKSKDPVLNAVSNTINPIVIHTPVSTTKFTITGDNNSDLPDQRLNRTEKADWFNQDLPYAEGFHKYSDTYINNTGVNVPRTTIDRTYTVNWTTLGNYNQEGFKDDMPDGKEEFYRNDMVSTDGDYVGLSYTTSMQTNVWIKEQYVMIPFHHVIAGKYYPGGTIHTLSPTTTTLTFTIAPNQTDLKNATISVYAVAKNAPASEFVTAKSMTDTKGSLGVIEIGKGEVQEFVNSGVHHTNDVNDVRNATADAKHHSYTQLRTDVVGRIGNLNVDEVEDPNYQELFRKDNKYSMQGTDIFNNGQKPQGVNNTTQSKPNHEARDNLENTLPITNEHIGKDKNNLPKIGYGVGFNFQTIGSYWNEPIYIRPAYLMESGDIPSKIYQNLSDLKMGLIHPTFNSSYLIKQNLGSPYQKYDNNDRVMSNPDKPVTDEKNKLMKPDKNTSKIMNLGGPSKITLSHKHNRMPILDAEKILTIPRGSDTTVSKIEFDKGSVEEKMAATNHNRWVGKFSLPSSSTFVDASGKEFPKELPVRVDLWITTGIPEYIVPEGTDGYHEAPDWVLNLSMNQPSTNAPEVTPPEWINPPGTEGGTPTPPPTKPVPPLPPGNNKPGEPNQIIWFIRRLTSANDLTSVGTH